MKLERDTHNLGFHLCKKQNSNDFICTLPKFGFSEKLTKATQTALHSKSKRFYGIINQDNAGF